MANNKKLNQIIAVEKTTKSRVHELISRLYHNCAKTELFNGFSRTYRKLNDEGEDLPPDKKIVQCNVNDFIKEFSNAMSELFDMTATKDIANCNAVADIVVDGQVMLEKAPATFILFLEKQINDIRSFVERIPVLDSAEDWTIDSNSNIYKTDKISTHKTKKVQTPIVLYEATDRHPAQTQIITEDMVVGYWDTVKHSGAMPASTKKVLLARVDKLAKAVKFAREEANCADAVMADVGSKILDFIFA
jgi:hypothetical protein